MEILSPLETDPAVPDFFSQGQCYLWRPDVLWLNVASDALLVVAFLVIPLTLILGLRGVKHLPYRWVIFMFSAFIFLSGVTHFMEILTIWRPYYYVQGLAKAVAAAVAVATAMLFIPVLPRAVEAMLRKMSNDQTNKEAS